MWELNDNLNVTHITIDGSPAYIIDDFYKDPDRIARWLFCRETPLWKVQERGTRNGIDFQDKRLDILSKRLPAHDFLQNLCGQNFKDDNINGTNIYDAETWNVIEVPESVEPWIPKTYSKIIHTFQAKYNRCVFFDGKKFPHGMAINDDRYHCNDFRNADWNTYRVNQVFFFEPKCGN